VALQKIRQHVDERNHLRLWRAAVNHDGRPVWVGQISRDIGIKFSPATFATHRIDPYVGEARTYMILDLVDSQYVWKWGYVEGEGEVTRSEPGYNYNRDPYYTDGLRLVLVLSEEPLNYDQLESLDWESARPSQTLLEE
jgi:hypothetical protein